MTQEEKQLLLKDISARLPYKVKCGITKKGVVRELKPMDNGISMPVNQVCDVTVKKTLNTDIINDFINDNIVLKPYLRPMSSMTEEEAFEFIQIGDSFLRIGEKKLTCILSLKQMDWLNAHHFDYRIDPSTGKTLIESDLAIEAPKDMYKTE